MTFINRSSIIFISYLIGCLTLIWPVLGQAEDAPIQIEADKMTSVEQTRSVEFSGAVDARQGDVRIRSDRMTVHYSEDTKQSSGDRIASQQVEKLICNGNVEISRGQWLGTSQKMIYLSKERQVILTGDAKAWQNQNMVSGDKIIYYLDEGRSEVSGGRTTTTVGDSPKNGEKPKRVNMTILQK